MCSQRRTKLEIGGEGGIRTHVPVTRQHAFEARPLRPLRYLSCRTNFLLYPVRPYAGKTAPTIAAPRRMALLDESPAVRRNRREDRSSRRGAAVERCHNRAV